MKRGCVGAPPTPPSHISFAHLRFTLRVCQNQQRVGADPCFVNAFNFAVDTCKRLYLLSSVVTGDLFPNLILF